MNGTNGPSDETTPRLLRYTVTRALSDPVMSHLVSCQANPIGNFMDSKPTPGKSSDERTVMLADAIAHKDLTTRLDAGTSRLHAR